MIKLVDVSKYYKTESTVVMGLHKVNLEFNIGEFVAITGESGSGKSTLLNVISGVDSYEDGELYIDNEETSYYSQADFEKFRKEHVAFIFQSYNLIENYSVLQNVEAALIIKNVEKKERIKRAKNIIDRVGLTSRIRAKTSKLSGGEKQRLAIARALAQNTKFIVADEPTGNLDSKSGEAILKLLHDLSKDKLIIIVTHNYEQVEPYITRKIRLFDGEVVEDKIIKQIEVVEENIIKNQNGVKNNIFKIPLKFALMNLLSQPKKTILILLVTIMTTFFLFIF
ncbi:MAG: ABC transporter ATP-binding protein, partial [Bacilli bacterium]